MMVFEARSTSEGSAGARLMPRNVLSALFRVAIAATRPDAILADRCAFDGRTWSYRDGDAHVEWDIPKDGRVLVIGSGKAAASFALGLEALMEDRIDDGLVIVKYGHGEVLRRIRILEAGHPVPDAAGQAAAGQLLDMVSDLRPQDRIFVVLTGGASSLLVQPVAGVTLADKATVTDMMLRSGMPIDEMNGVRTALSQVKGGKLLDAIAPAQALTLMVSDVPTDDPAIIGSGPTVPGPRVRETPRDILARRRLWDRLPANIRTALEKSASPSAPPPISRHVIVANSLTGLAAAEAAAIAMGNEVVIVDAHMDGATHQKAAAFVARMREVAANRRPSDPPVVLLAAGETVLTVTGQGRGGRNQEFALVAALALAGEEGLHLLAAGTDGTDGPTDAAGAFVDGGTICRASHAGIDPAKTLAANDSYTMFTSLSDSFVTGPTGTNVMDLVIGLVCNSADE